MVASEDDFLSVAAASASSPEARGGVRRRRAPSLEAARLAVKLELETTTPLTRFARATSCAETRSGCAERMRRAATRRADGVAVERKAATRIAATGERGRARGTSVVVAVEASVGVSYSRCLFSFRLQPRGRVSSGPTSLVRARSSTTAPLLRAARRRPRVPRWRTGTSGRISATAATTTGRRASPSRQDRRGAARGCPVRDRTAASARPRHRVTGRRARGARTTTTGEATRRIGVPPPCVPRRRTREALARGALLEVPRSPRACPPRVRRRVRGGGRGRARRASASGCSCAWSRRW